MRKKSVRYFKTDSLADTYLIFSEKTQKKFFLSKISTSKFLQQMIFFELSEKKTIFSKKK